MTNDPTPEDISDINLLSLRLRSGTWLQLHNLTEGSNKRGVEFISAIHGKCIFVTLPMQNNQGSDFQVGGRYLVKGFNGTNDFAFTSNILQIQYEPFAHAHLSYPESVKTKVVRHAPRTKVSIPATLRYREENISIPGAIKDLSVAGAMIESSIPFWVSETTRSAWCFRRNLKGMR